MIKLFLKKINKPTVSFLRRRESRKKNHTDYRFHGNDISRDTQKGFSLIEAVLYVGIIGMVIGAFIGFVLMMFGLRNKFHTINEVQANKRAVTEILDHYLRSAKQITAPAKLTANAVDRLEFISNEGVASAISLKDGRLVFADDALFDEAITSDDVVISDVQIINLGTASSTDIIKLTGKIEGSSFSSVDYIFEDKIQYNVNLSQ